MNKSLFFVIIFVLFLAFFSNTLGKTYKGEVYYKVITVEHTDNLWNISSKYKHPTVSTKNFVNEIVDFNKLDTTNITSGQTLIIPVYD